MNAPIWIEQLNALNQVTSRTRFSGDALRVGRSYVNDLVLDDPGVSPVHLFIRIAPDGVITAQAEGENTLCFAGYKTPLREASINGDSILIIGHTRLRVRAADYPVDNQKVVKIHASPTLLTMGVLFMLASVLLMALDQWFTAADATPFWRLLPGNLTVAFAILLWSGSWALVSRLLGHWGKFCIHLFIASAGLCAIAAVDIVLEPVLYGLSLSPPPYLGKFLTSLLGVLIVYVHLGALGERFQPLKLRYLGIAMLTIGATVAIRGYIAHEDNGSIPNIVTAYPPGLRLVETRPLDQMLGELNSMEREVLNTLEEPAP